VLRAGNLTKSYRIFQYTAVGLFVVPVKTPPCCVSHVNVHSIFSSVLEFGVSLKVVYHSHNVASLLLLNGERSFFCHHKMFRLHYAVWPVIFHHTVRLASVLCPIWRLCVGLHCCHHSSSYSHSTPLTLLKNAISAHYVDPAPG